MVKFKIITTRINNINTTQLYRDSDKIAPGKHSTFDRVFYTPSSAYGPRKKADDHQREFYEVIARSVPVVANLIEVKISEVKKGDTKIYVIHLIGSYKNDDGKTAVTKQLQMLQKYLKDQDAFVLTEDAPLQQKIPAVGTYMHLF